MIWAFLGAIYIFRPTDWAGGPETAAACDLAELILRQQQLVRREQLVQVFLRFRIPEPFLLLLAQPICQIIEVHSSSLLYIYRADKGCGSSFSGTFAAAPQKVKTLRFNVSFRTDISNAHSLRGS